MTPWRATCLAATLSVLCSACGPADPVTDGGPDALPVDAGRDQGPGPDGPPPADARDGDPDAADGTTGPGPLFLHDPASPRTAPLPSDLFRDPDTGRVTLDEAPSGDGTDIGFVLDTLGELSGFSVSTGAGFPFEGEVDPSSLASEGAAAPFAGPAGLARLEGDTLVEVPSTLVLRPGRLAVLPRLGVVLDDDADHVAWVTDGLTDTDGRAAVAAPRFAALRDGTYDPGGSGLTERERQLLEPALAALQKAGVTRSRLVAATRFRTQRIGRAVEDALAVIDESPVPLVTVERVLSTAAELDDLLGQPAEHLPGVDNPGTAGPGGPAGLAHDALLAVVLGTHQALDFVSDEVGQPGRFRFGADGRPEPKATRPVPFALTLPRQPAGGSYASMPVVIWHHGLNNNRASVFGVADALAHAGIATLAYDAVFHGGRAAAPVDQKHNLTGVDGPDGLADLDPVGGIVAVFSFASDPPFQPAQVRDAFRQLCLDVDQAARMLGTADLAPVRTALAGAGVAGLDTLSFDATRIGYLGESLGGITGGLAAATTTRIGAFVLSVPGGGIVNHLISLSPSFNGLARTLVAPALGLEVAELDPALGPPTADPTLALLQQVIDDADPLAYSARASRPRRPHLLILQAQHDELIPHQATQALAASWGLAVLTTAPASPELLFVELEPAPAPAAGNLASGETGVLVSLGPATHGMTIDQRGQQTYQPEGPPFEALPQAVPIDNPIVQVQALAAAFLLDHAQGRLPTVLDPATAPSPFRP